MKTKVQVRINNGYLMLLMPEHPKCSHSENWGGYVYEHIVVAEEYLGRPLRDDEVVHHLDGNRSHNRHENLLVLESGQHTRLHAWLKAGAPFQELPWQDVEVTTDPSLYCAMCGKTLQDGQLRFCSVVCCDSSPDRRKVARPSPKQIAEDTASMPMVAVGRKYGVSDNAVRKWIKSYEIAGLMPHQKKDL